MSKPLHCNIRISFNERPDDLSMFAAVREELSVSCGDFSEERLVALQKELARKLTASWNYLASQRNGGIDESC